MNFLGGYRRFASFLCKLWLTGNNSWSLGVLLNCYYMAAAQAGGWAGRACLRRWSPSRSRPRYLVQGGKVTLGWPYWGCPITSSTAGAQFGRASLINTTQSPSIPLLPLHLSTLTHLVNLGHHATRSPILISVYTPHIRGPLRIGPNSREQRHQRWQA